MVVFIGFVVIVLLGLTLQWLSQQWALATFIPCSLFILLLTFTPIFEGGKVIALTLGLPMVFCAALLGSYLYETRINPSRLEDTQTDK